jgi:hypothetical protein
MDDLIGSLLRMIVLIVSIGRSDQFRALGVAVRSLASTQRFPVLLRPYPARRYRGSPHSYVNVLQIWFKADDKLVVYR